MSIQNDNPEDFYTGEDNCLEKHTHCWEADENWTGPCAWCGVERPEHGSAPEDEVAEEDDFEPGDYDESRYHEDHNL